MAEEQSEAARRKHQLEKRRREEEEKAREQEEKKIVLQELERKKKIEEEEEKARQEELERETQERLQQEEIRRFREEEETRQEEEREKLRQEEEENSEVRRINKRIREIEESIAMLDWQLERQKIEKMKVKTQKVIKRISEVVADNEIDGGEALKKETVRLFLFNKSLWKKYVKIELEGADPLASD